ncbi:Uncharacterised protein [Klebsiella pneumoniae]|nr:Uncharacterised protein [Klebsiella pneumoniae]
MRLGGEQRADAFFSAKVGDHPAQLRIGVFGINRRYGGIDTALLTADDDHGRACPGKAFSDA